MRIAIVGTGIAGLTCAHLLRTRHDITVFERDHRPGGHTNTVSVELDDGTYSVDTGFIVYNERNYPGLVRLFARLGIATAPSNMSFSVADDTSGIEWRATSATTVFAQRRNALRPEFVRMLTDIARFNRHTRSLHAGGIPDGLTLSQLVAEQRWSPRLIDWYLAPMVSAIWSTPLGDALDIPVATFVSFFNNHGLLQRGAQPRWRTVASGARTYVEAILSPLGRRVRLATPVTKILRQNGGIELMTERDGPEYFDHVILAAHGDQSLALLGDPTPAERAVLGGFRYQPNDVLLHTDSHLLPRARRAWASWNYRVGGAVGESSGGATVTYHMNRLQSIESRHQICVTLNQAHLVDPRTVVRRFRYAHPVLDAAALAAQARHGEINGTRSTWYCGAYWGYGFHEDGVQSALRVCRAFGADL